MSRLPVIIACIVLTSEAMALGTCVTDTSQADFQGGSPTDVTLTAGGDVVLASSSVVDQQNEDISASSRQIHHFWWYAQTFEAGISGPLTAVDIMVFCHECSGTPPDIRVSIRATSNGEPSGPDLAFATIPGFSSPVANWYTATFATPMTMTAETTYALVVGANGLFPTGTGIYRYLVSADVSVYEGGQRLTSTTAGNSWVPQNFDTGFRIYSGSGFVAAGNLDSSLKDSAPGPGDTEWDTLSWAETTPADTVLEFQAAASNSPSGPFDFVGPDGTPGTTYTTSGADLGQFDGFRYLKYKALLSSSDSANTPVLHEATVCFDVVEESADLSVAKTDGQATATPGSSLSYTIVAGNAGPDPVPDASVVDIFPSELENCSWTCIGNNGGECAASGVGDIDESVNLPVGGSVLFTGDCDIPGSFTGLLENTVTVSSSLTDPQPANNTASDSTDVQEAALLRDGFE